MAGAGELLLNDFEESPTLPCPKATQCDAKMRVLATSPSQLDAIRKDPLLPRHATAVATSPREGPFGHHRSAGSEGARREILVGAVEMMAPARARRHAGRVARRAGAQRFTQVTL